MIAMLMNVKFQHFYFENLYLGSDQPQSTVFESTK